MARLVPPAVVVGIALGLGFGFMLQGIRMMQTDWLVAVLGGAVALLLMGNKTVPLMFVLLAFGALVGGVQHPELLTRLGNASISLRVPAFALPELAWNQVFAGVVLLALPQIPLTLGNAVVAIVDENNRIFPHSPVTEGRVAVSTGIMNLFSGVVGGVPMCHGAGGMAAHLAFGARTGGCVVILGCLLLALALFFSSSVDALFQLFPSAVLGVVLFLTGLQLAAGSSVLPAGRADRVVVLVCAALCMWNVAAGFMAGLVLHHLNATGRLRL
jgi:MFS superfamily sulfate permease-like transporter